MSPRNILCAFPAPVPVGHRVELTFFERRHIESGGVFTSRVTRKAEPYLPLVRDLDTGIVYADELHFEGPAVHDGMHKGVEAHRSALREVLQLSSKLTAIETLSGRVTACVMIGSVWDGLDRRTHTRLVITPEPLGYRD